MDNQFKVVIITVFIGFPLYWLAIPIFDINDDTYTQAKDGYFAITVLAVPVFLSLLNFILSKHDTVFNFVLNALLIILFTEMNSERIGHLWFESFRWINRPSMGRMAELLKDSALIIAVTLNAIGLFVNIRISKLRHSEGTSNKITS